MSVNYRAAYVPEQEFRDWEDATQLAVTHVEDECDRYSEHGLLVTHTIPGGGYTTYLEGFVARHSYHVSLRSRGRRPHPGQRPTLVYVPDDELLEVAAGHARGWALCAVESSMFRLEGWVAATGALNLDTEEVTPPVSPDVAEQLDRLAFYGNNGWGRAVREEDGWPRARGPAHAGCARRRLRGRVPDREGLPGIRDKATAGDDRQGGVAAVRSVRTGPARGR